MLITFQLTARLVDLRVRRHAGRSVRAYLRAVPETARRPSASDRTSEPVPVAEIGVGDEVRVGADERIPVDGVILSAQSWVDHSMLTGESHTEPLEAHGVTVPPADTPTTEVCVVRNRHYIGRIRFSEQLRPDAVYVIRQIR